MREIAVFGGSAHPALTAEICAFLSVPVRLTRFANDCLEVQLAEAIGRIHNGESVNALFDN